MGDTKQLKEGEVLKPSHADELLNYVLNFPMPTTGFSHNYLTLKITPTPETKASITKEFFTGLRAVDLPLVLEIVGTSKSIYYQLSFAPQYEDKVNQQLELCFPEFIIEPLVVERSAVPQRLALPAAEIPLPPHLEHLKSLFYNKNKALPNILTKTLTQKFIIPSQTHLEDTQALKKNIRSTPTLDRYLSRKPKAAQLEAKTDSIYTMYLRPSYIFGYFPSANEFGFDPYNRIFNLFQNLEHNSYAAIQFVMSPFSKEALDRRIASFSDLMADDSHFRHWEESINEMVYENFRQGKYYPISGSKELIEVRFEREQVREDTYKMHYFGTFKQRSKEAENLLHKYSTELPKRNPAWLLGVNLFSSHKNLLADLVADFFKLFTKHNQTWFSSDPFPTTITKPYLFNWGLVSTDELVALAHFPTSKPTFDKVELTTMQTNKPPDLYLSGGIVIGQTKIRNETKTIHFPNELRPRHFAIFGRSGTGKSTLIANCFRQDAEAGTAIAVVDPHGDLAQEVLDHIPPNRVNDVIYINPADSDYPIGFDLMTATGDLEISNYTDDLLITINRFGAALGNRMENILKFVFHTLLRIKGSTLMDVEKLLLDEGFRKKSLSKIDNERVIDFWRSEFPQEPKETVAALLTRFNSLSLTPPLRNLLSQRESKFNFYDSIQSKKIVIFDFAQGRLGQRASHLLGSMVISQYQLAIQRRVDIPREKRHLLALYIDEFQTVSNPAFGQVMNEARKFGLGVTIATQFPSLIPDTIRKPILGNTGTFIFLQLESTDAQALRYELGNFTPEDVANLDAVRYEAICRPATKAKDAFLIRTPPPQKPTNFRTTVIEQSRANYSNPQIAPAMPLEAPTVAPVAQTSKATSLPYKPKQPAPALEKKISAKDKILYYVEQAGYLSNLQIAELCYSHYSNLKSKKSAASRDLNELVDSKRLKSMQFGAAIVYYTSRLCNPTAHNLGVRNIYVLSALSGFEIAETLFAPDLKKFIPDLQINFFAIERDEQIKIFWEFDAGTENAPELIKKIKNYENYKDDSLIVFVFDSEKRMLEMEKALPAVDYIIISYVGKFASLTDEGFRRLGNQNWFALIERDI